MASEPIVLDTLRRLMRPRMVLRCNFCVFHDGGANVTNFTLELAQAGDDGLSIIEYCADGEMVASCKMEGAGPELALNERVIHRAMQTLWRDRVDVPCHDVVSVRATSMLATTPAGMQGSIVQGWHYRRTDDGGAMELWTDKQEPAVSAIAAPNARGLREMVMALQLSAEGRHGELDGLSASATSKAAGTRDDASQIQSV